MSHDTICQLNSDIGFVSFGSGSSKRSTSNSFDFGKPAYVSSEGNKVCMAGLK